MSFLQLVRNQVVYKSTVRLSCIFFNQLFAYLTIAGFVLSAGSPLSETVHNTLQPG